MSLAPKRPAARIAWLPLAMIALAVAALVVGGVRHALGSHQAEAVARLQAVALLESRSVADWLGERQRQAQFLRSDMMAGHALDALSQAGDPVALEGLRLYLISHGWQSAWMFDRQGRLSWSLGGYEEGEPTPADQWLVDALGPASREAARQRTVQRWEPASLPPDGRPQAVWLAPLGRQGQAPEAVIALRAQASDAFSAGGLAWPDAGRSEETLIVRRYGRELVAITPLREPQALGAQGRASLDAPELLAAKALRGGPDLGRVIEARDYRGAEVLGVAREIAGTDWLLVSKVDRREVLRRAGTDAVWVVVFGLVLLLLASSAVFQLRQRRMLDVSERTRTAQGERLQALRLLDAIVENSGDAISAKDAQGRYLLFNREAVRLLGRPATEVIGRDDAELFPLLQAQRLQALDREVLARGERIQREEMATLPDGQQVALLVASGPLYDAQGALAGVFSIARDITERKRAERALRESEQRWILAIEGAGHGVWDWNLADGTVFLSDQWKAMLGYAPQELRSDAAEFFARLHPKDTEAFHRTLEAHLKGLTPAYRLELRLRHRDGSYRWILDQGRVTLRDADGKALRMMGTHTDITASRAAQEELRRLWLAVEQSPNSIMITNAQGDIEFVNDALCRTSGYPREALLGRNPRMLSSGQTPAGTYLEMWETLARGEVWRGEVINRRPDGQEYVERILISPVRQEDGQRSHYLAIKEDITERRRLDEELAQHRHRLEELVAARTAELADARRLAEAANRAKSAFLANMSHEIRTPMNAIVGLAHLLRQEDPTPEQCARLEGIDSAVRFLLAIISDVLDLSKIEAGRIELESTPFSPTEVLESVRGMVAEQARAKGLELIGDYAGLPALVRGDPTRLRQALLNFASNAVKFTEQGRVVLRAWVLTGTPDSVRLHFEVEDTGIGIAQDKLPRIFDPFEQADTSTTRRFGGTGLGLAITRRIALLMGGEVAVRSSLGQGTVFSLTAPFGAVLDPSGGAQSAASDLLLSEAPARLRALPAGTRILLVDDNTESSAVVAALLAHVGLDSDHAADGQEALEALERRDYSLVLMDVLMPRMDGLEATRRLRARPGPRLPVVALTASAFEDKRRACLAAGMDAFLAKPVEPELLYATLWRLLGGTDSQAVLDGAATPGQSAVCLPARRSRPPASSPPGGAPAVAVEPAPAGSPVEPAPAGADFEALRRRLVDFLEEGDIRAAALARKERRALEAALGAPRTTRLLAALAAYDHDAALRLLASPNDD